MKQIGWVVLGLLAASWGWAGGQHIATAQPAGADADADPQTNVADAAEAEAGARFAGWQGLRVIVQEGSPAQMRAIDIDGDGRVEPVGLNTRMSRLDVYGWLPADQREPPPEPRADRPNELPMAPEFSHTEIATDRLPNEMLAHDMDGDGRLELIVLESPPNRVSLYRRAEADADGEQAGWFREQSWELLAGNVTGRANRMIWHPNRGEAPTLLISFNEGIQQLTLAEDERASWLEPREQRGRAAWWLADVDGDGDADLVEWVRQAGEQVRWRENTGDDLLPSRGLSELSPDGLEVLAAANDQPAHLLLLGGLQSGVLRRYRMELDEAEPYGRRQPLPLEGGATTPWAGVELGDRKALVKVDADQPRLDVYWLNEGGWSGGESFPIIADVQKVIAPTAAPGTLLLWAKDAGVLHQSHWQDGRLSFPRPLNRDEADAPADADDGGNDDADAQNNDPGDRRVLALDRAGATTWWVQQAGDDLLLHTWKHNPPRTLRFVGAGNKAEKVRWLGGRRLLVHQQYARSPVLVEAGEGDQPATITSPSHLAKSALDQFTLITDDDGELRLARMRDGVLQWLDEDLQPLDQVMLPDDLRMVGYLPQEDGAALALQAGGEQLHRLEPDGAGVMRLARSYRLPGGQQLVEDPVVGLMLIDAQQLTRLAPGRPGMLELVDSIDSRVGRPSGVKEATIHRMGLVDIDADGRDELLLADDERHQLTVLRVTDQKLEPMISWPVFEDSSYPYGGDQYYMGPETRGGEPREVVGGDLDGDGAGDLALLCHDRLLIYLGRTEDHQAAAEAGERPE